MRCDGGGDQMHANEGEVTGGYEERDEERGTCRSRRDFVCGLSMSRSPVWGSIGGVVKGSTGC